MLELNEHELRKIKGGKIIRLNQWVLYNTRTKKTFADNNAIMRTATHTIVNGWVRSFGRIR